MSMNNHPPDLNEKRFKLLGIHLVSAASMELINASLSSPVRLDVKDPMVITNVCKLYE